MDNSHAKFDASLDVKVEVSDEVTQCSQNEVYDINECYDSAHGVISQLLDIPPKMNIDTRNTNSLNDNEQVKTLDLNCVKVEEGSVVDDLKDGCGQSAAGVVKVEIDETHLLISSDVNHTEGELAKIEDGEGSISALLADDESENLFPADRLHCVRANRGKLLSLLIVGFYFILFFAVAVE